MKIIEQSHEILDISENALKIIEVAGRTCYKSERNITKDSSEKFVKMLINRGHHAMIEFADVTVKFITNRGITHEFVRHRLCSYAQESTRYVRYNDIQYIKPYNFSEWSKSQKDIWEYSMRNSEKAYTDLLKQQLKPEIARGVLPNDLKTEICVKTNIREWRYIFKLRMSKQAHPQFRELLTPCLKSFKDKIPVLFDDLGDTL